MKFDSLLFTLITFFTSQFAISQELKLAGVNFTYFPQASVDEELNNNPQFTLSESKFFVNLPKPLKNGKTIIINGIDYSLLSVNAENNAGGELEFDNLHTIGYRLAVVQELKNNWRGIISLMPTLSSSFNDELEGDDFLFNAVIQFVKEKSETFSYGFGVIFTSRFGEPLVLPSLSLLKETDRQKLEILLPTFLSYHLLRGNVAFGLKLAVSGSRYNTGFGVEGDVNIPQLIDQIQYSRGTFGPDISYRLNSLILLELSGGMTFNRTFEITQIGLADLDYSIENGPFIQFGISLSLKKD